MRKVVVVSSIYLAVGSIAAAYTWYKGTYDPAHSEFAGLPLLLLALPWSWLFRGASLHILSDQYNNNLLLETTFVVLNAAFLAVILIVVQKMSSSKNRIYRTNTDA